MEAHAPNTPVAQVSGFRKVYNTTVAVDNLDFTVEPGAILGLLGPNGAGKTTLLRGMAGIIPPTRGWLLIGGHDVVREPVEAKQRLAYVPDDPHLFDALTVWEHLEFIAALYRVADYEPKADALLERFELTRQRNTMAHELSRGMRQKVAIACAYIHAPQLILMDEPMTGLDPRGIRTLKESITEEAAKGTAVIVSSHLLALIQDLCTSLLIIHHGRKVYMGSATQARSLFGERETDPSLEDVFFRATGQADSPFNPST